MKHFVDMSIRYVAVVCRNVSCHMSMHCHFILSLKLPPLKALYTLIHMEKDPSAQNKCKVAIQIINV